jgi:hypothetical protein
MMSLRAPFAKQSPPLFSKEIASSQKTLLAMTPMGELVSLQTLRAFPKSPSAPAGQQRSGDCTGYTFGSTFWVPMKIQGGL